jgi:hypothetical protein
VIDGRHVKRDAIEMQFRCRLDALLAS